MPLRSSTLNEIEKQIGERIRAQRLCRGLTQAQLADQLGLTKQQVQKYEKGIDRVFASRLMEIAAALHTPLARFQMTEDNPADDDNLLNNLDAIRMARAFKRVCGKWRPFLIEMVEGCGKRWYPSCDE